MHKESDKHISLALPLSSQATPFARISPLLPQGQHHGKNTRWIMDTFNSTFWGKLIVDIALGHVNQQKERSQRLQKYLYQALTTESRYVLYIAYLYKEWNITIIRSQLSNNSIPSLVYKFWLIEFEYFWNVYIQEGSKFHFERNARTLTLYRQASWPQVNIMGVFKWHVHW